MTAEPQDRMIRAIAAGGEVRATILTTTALTREIQRRHQMDPVVAAATSRVAASALLLSTALKGDQSVTIEVRGAGPLTYARATANASGGVRAYASHDTFPDAERPATIQAAFGAEGRLLVIRDLGLGEPYQGVTPLITGSVAHDLTFYYLNSEQIRTAVGMDERFTDAGECEASGAFLVQALPPAGQTVQDELRHLALTEQMADRVEGLPPLRELLADGGLDPEVLLAEFFPEGFSILEDSPVAFRCACSQERMQDGLRMLGRAEVEEAFASEGEPLHLHCHFCNNVYPVYRKDLPWGSSERG